MRKPILWSSSAAPGQYHSYLVRLWRPTRSAEWRIMAEAVASGDRYMFTDLVELLAFLQGQVRSPPTDAQASLFER